MKTGLMGVVHVPAMPGDPAHRQGDYRDVESWALRDAEALVAGGVDGIMLENFGSAPFHKGTPEDRVPAHQLACLAMLARICVERFEVSVGVNCLRNDSLSALGIAAAVGAHAIRVNVHTGAYVTDQGLIEGHAAQTLTYRRQLHAEHVSILADVLVKHATPLAPVAPDVATRDTLQRGLADAVIVTGDGTGQPVSRALLEAVRAAAGDKPVWVGSGLSPAVMNDVGALIDGAVVGTWLKAEGRVDAPVDVARVRDMVAAWRSRPKTLRGV